MLYHQIRKKTPIFFFAHRGAPNLGPENSIESVSKAINRGCHGIEIDIQTTLDNQIILFHDDFIVSNNKKYFINQISYQKIREICAINNAPQPNLFKELIPLIINNPNIVFNIEIKSRTPNNYKILSYILNNLNQEILYNQCIISSFNYFLLYQLRFLFLYRGPMALILASEHLKGKLSLKIHKAIIMILNPGFIHMNINNTNQSFINWTHKKSKIINTYTVNSQSTLDKCIAWNVDGIFTDNHTLYQ